jgi:molybdate transport system substrate-binding protein
MKTRQVALAAAVTAVVLPLAACGGDDDASGGGKSATLTVLAASSLTDVFPRAAKVYEKSHPGTRIRFSFAGSQELAAQVRQGSPADALVTADTRTMDGLKSEIEGTTAVIAKNRLTIATPKDNPAHVNALADLSRKDTKVVLAAPEVPVGRYSRQILDRQGLEVKAVSQEANVRAVLSKVELGEADAGIVYKTDATAAHGKVATVGIPDAQNAIASYPAATLKASQHADAASAFVKWLSGAKAQKLLRDAGFAQP